MLSGRDSADTLPADARTHVPLCGRAVGRSPEGTHIDKTRGRGVAGGRKPYRQKGRPCRRPAARRPAGRVRDPQYIGFWLVPAPALSALSDRRRDGAGVAGSAIPLRVPGDPVQVGWLR